MRGRWRGHRGAVILVAGAIAFGTLPAPSRAAVLERAPDVPIGPDAISTTVELGRYAVNGTVRAAVADPAAGATYIGGDFTRIGVRTGSVVVVDPPGVSDGALRAGSPEVMGAVGAVFPDDRAGDPGFFIVGFLTAINGQKASQQPVHRMHLVNGAWVVDTSWTVTGECTTVYTGFPVGSPWIATPTYLIGGGMAGPKAPYNSTTGLMVIARASGRLRHVGGSGCLPADNLLPSIPPLPDLTACASLTYCQASAGRLAWDSTSQVLLVEYGYAVGTSLVAMWSDLVAYDLTAGTGGRSWRLPLQAEPGRTAVLQ